MSRVKWFGASGRVAACALGIALGSIVAEAQELPKVVSEEEPNARMESVEVPAVDVVEPVGADASALGVTTAEVVPPPVPTPSCAGKHSCVAVEQPIEVIPNVWVSAGTVRSFTFPLLDSYEGGEADIPVTVIRGKRPGPTLVLTGSIHGDEMIGVPIMLQLRETVKPEDLGGTLVLLPVVNSLGFQTQSRYLPDRRDLNRFFPGNSRGSLANRIAHRIFQTFLAPADYCVDFHTAAGDRANAPHVRADPRDPASRDLAQGFGGMVVLHEAQEGTLRYAAAEIGVPTALFEGGEPGRIDAKSVEVGVRGVENLLATLGMHASAAKSPAPPLWLHYSPWIRADSGGIVELAVALGDVVQANQLLLTIRDTLKGEPTEMRAPVPGIVMSIARGPVTQPGNALLRLGIIDQPLPAAAPPAEEEAPE